MGGGPDRGLGERVLPGHASEVRPVLRTGRGEVLLSTGERDVLGGRKRESGHRGCRISGTACPVRSGSTQARASGWRTCSTGRWDSKRVRGAARDRTYGA